MNIQELTAYINQNVRNNGVQAITGDLMQNVLNSIVATLTDGANIVPGSVTRGAIAPGAVDNTPTAGSNNLITSTAVAAAIKAIQTVVLENKELTDAELQNIIKTANGLTDAVNDRIPISEKGMYGGVATLGEDGRVPASQLPGFVDDVKEGYLFEGKFYRDAEHTEEIEPQGDMIYIDLVTDKEYRWGGTIFAPISESLALGETASTAYAGDKGKRNAEDIERLKTGKQDTLVSGENLKTLNGESILGAGDIKIPGGGSAGPISITWAELVALRDAGGLTVGAEYRITDYITTTDRESPYTYSATEFDVIVTALSENELSEDARAINKEGFAKYDVEGIKKWKLKYKLDNTLWAHTTKGKGVIYQLTDEFNIQIPYDFKTIKFAHSYGFSSGKKYTYTFFNPDNLNEDVSLSGMYSDIKVIHSDTLLGSVMFGYSETIPLQNINVKIQSAHDLYHYIVNSANINISKISSSGVKLDSCKNININGDIIESSLTNVTDCIFDKITFSVIKNVNHSTFGKLYNAIISDCSWIKSGDYDTNGSTSDWYLKLTNCNILDIGTSYHAIELVWATGSIGKYCQNIRITANNVKSSIYLSIGASCQNIAIVQKAYSYSCLKIGQAVRDIKVCNFSNIVLGNQCNNINIGKDADYFHPYMEDVLVGEKCTNLDIFGTMKLSARPTVGGLTIKSNVSYLTISPSSNDNADFKNATIYMGGTDTEPITIDSTLYNDDYKFATRNSAGEYKVFVLGDLAPA